ncbi:hypothetical protein ABI59_00655 [Acidobacteria bacterium Mor1]|nr:hypothetical protein ABI59_00655 [Acidobacteria bacterium Mor1]
MSRTKTLGLQGPILAGTALLAAFLCSGCVSVAGRSDSPEAGKPDKATLHRGDFQRSLLLTGELEAVRSIAIKSPQTSQFQMRVQFMAEEGSTVDPGDPLLDFDNSTLAERVRTLEIQILEAETQIVSTRNELASTLKDLEIELAEARYTFDRDKLEASIDPVVVSAKEYAERQLALEKATRELEETEARIDLTRRRGEAQVEVLEIDRDKLRKDLISANSDLDLLSIQAPARGLVVYAKRPQTTLRFQEGDSCWPGQQIMQLPDLSEMQVAFWVNEVDAPLLEAGMPIRVALDAFPGRELSGEIQRVPSMAVKRDPQSRIAMFKVVASLEETWVGEMKPGMSALGELVLEDREDAPLVPREMIVHSKGSYWLAGTNREIHPVARNEEHYLITEEEFLDLQGKRPTAGTPGKRSEG